MIEELKIHRTTKKGTRIRVPVTVDRDDGRIYFIGSQEEMRTPFELKDEIKAMQGSRWHGYIPDDGRQIWSVADCTRNNFQLDYLQGKKPYANWDQPVWEYGYSRPLFEHQKLMTNHCLTYHYKILAAEMGCISGDAIVHCNRAGRGFKATLADLFYKWQRKKDHGGKLGQKSWDVSIPTFVRSMKDGLLGLHRLIDVLDKGVREVVRVTLESGKTLTCTPDHEIFIDVDTCVPASELSAGDTVLTNGTWIDKDGYVRAGGLKNKHPRWTTGGVYEHILVMEKKLGRHVAADEVVHHKNGIRHNNRVENLELIKSHSAHAKHHGVRGNFMNLDGSAGRVFFVPKLDTVVSVTPAGEERVFDLVMDDPYRNFVADGFIVHNCGKTLSAIEVLEKSGFEDWWWVGPKSALAAVKREFDKWGLTVQPTLLTYDRLRIDIERWEKGRPAPQGVIFDESSRLKTASAKRTKAAQHLADAIRAEYGWDGYVILMSGTPAPKSPVDWWAQCEICYPGFLREGSAKAFEWRLAIFQQEMTEAGKFWKRVAWRDDTRRCETCGEFDDHASHGEADAFNLGEVHEYAPSKNEVAYLYQRLDGLVLPLAKKDCLDIPDKNYREIVLKPTSTVKRVAKALAGSAVSAIQGLTWLRELSDGFQYREKQEGAVTCPVCKGEKRIKQWRTDPETEELYEELSACDKCGGTGEVPNMVRETKQIKTPKDQAIRDLLEENEDQGRLVLCGGFHGTIDRITDICLKKEWDVCKVDGRGWRVIRHDGEKADLSIYTGDNQDRTVAYWADMQRSRVAFVMQPGTGGMGLTLTEARMMVFVSNDYRPESRSQAEDRIHRTGMDENKGATIVDLFHLGTDRKVLNVLRDNRRLEKMTLEEFQEMIDV